jgi:outer membrane protein TolC
MSISFFKPIKRIIAILMALFLSLSAVNAQNKVLSLDQVLALAKEQSPDAVLAKHQFRSSYWEFRSYKAGKLPSLSMNSNLLGFSRSYEPVTQNDGSTAYRSVNLNNTTFLTQISQNVAFTGGYLFLESGLDRFDNFLYDTAYYSSVPLKIGYSQSTFQFNQFRWQKKIEPLKYDEAKKEYIRRLEEISEKAVSYFFDLALAQLNVDIAQMNYSNNDTIYKISRGRYNIGTIAENDLLQSELALLNSKSELAQSKINLAINKFRLRSFLGFNELVDIKLVIPDTVPVFEIATDEAVNKANENSGTVISFQRQLLESERDVAKAKAESRFNAELYASFGLNQTAAYITNAYEKPENQQKASLGIRIPIIDWGEGKGRYRMAQSQQEVVKTQVEQARIDFEQEVLLKVMQFNEQDAQVLIASKADEIARKRYEVTKQRFLIGKIGVLDLNIASQEKDLAQRSFIQSQKSYWTYFYNIRQFTLFDFQNDTSLNVDLKELEY